MNKPDLLLIDGTAYLYRAYHAMPRLSNTRGEPTGAILGVIQMLHKVLETCQPMYAAMIWDSGGETFRDTLYGQYKANRPAMPEALVQQIAPLEILIPALGVPLLRVPGVEADDVIATLATQAAARGLRTWIDTADKDLAQLVSPHIQLFHSNNGELWDREAVRQKFGVAPEQLGDYLSLVGDASDHIPGIPGWGKKTAAKWLQTYGSLEKLLERAQEIPGRAGQSLRAHRDQLPRFRQLIQLKTDVPLEQTPESLKLNPPDLPLLRDWYRRLEFERLLDSLPPVPEEARHYVRLDSAALENWMNGLARGQPFALAVVPPTGTPWGLGLCKAGGEAVYLPLPEDAADPVWHRFQALLENPEQPKLGHDLKGISRGLRQRGLQLRGMAQDVLLAAYVLDSTARQLDLESLARKHLGRTLADWAALTGKGRKARSVEAIPEPQLARYGAARAEVSWALHETFSACLREEPQLLRLYADLEIPLVAVLDRMEEHGVALDCARLQAQSQQLARRMQVLEREAQAVAGHPFNLNSPKQIRAVLFQELGLPVLEKTPKGEASTAESVLQALAESGERLPQLILDYRRLAKLKSTYTDRLPQQIDPQTGRVHTIYHQAVTATGRLSSSDPNLQNIPIRTEEGRQIRRAFVASPGDRLLAADYSQIELRILAHLSREERLLAAFQQDWDIHRATAAEVWHLPLEAVSAEQRRAAKAINFGLLYGMSAFGLARQIGVPREEAQTYLERYFQRYPGVQAYLEQLRTQARRNGYVETLFGRRLYLRDIDHSNQARRAAAERAAINAPMQGTAADLIKKAMIALDAWIQAEAPAVRMILQVHDELVFEVPEAQLAQVQEPIRRLMENVAQLAVPLKVEIGVGKNWEEAH